MAEVAAATVLAVDDDLDVLDLASTVLQDAGYTVLEAHNGAAALELLNRHAEITLLFTDIVMPGMTGFELADRAKAMKPELFVIYTSAYHKNILSESHVLKHGPLIPKPWRKNQILTAIQELISNS